MAGADDKCIAVSYDLMFSDVHSLFDNVLSFKLLLRCKLRYMYDGRYVRTLAPQVEVLSCCGSLVSYGDTDAIIPLVVGRISPSLSY